MMQSTPRKLTLFDGMVLVAALAVGLALIRLVFHPTSGLRDPWRAAWAAFCAIVAFLMPGTVAWMVLRLRRARPPYRRLAREPGMVASCAALSAASCTALCLKLVHWGRVDGGALSADCSTMLGVSQNGPYAVAGAWLILALGGWWRREPTWIDRLGRAIGFTWLAAGITRDCLLMILLA